MSDAILVLNAGSSSLKFSIFEVGRGADGLLARGQIEGIGTAPRFVLRGARGGAAEEQPLPAGARDHEGALRFVLDQCPRWLEGHRIVAAGHRVVHGGVKYAAPVAVTPAVLAELEQLVPLAPLHQPHNLAAINAAVGAMPFVPQVACFDTAFHRAQPEVAQRFGLPRRFTDEGVRRYGFHGLSYEYVASVLPDIDPRAAAGRTVVAHLGNGASMCAMLGGRSVATTMSFTPADGLVMGTRVGSLGPGAVLYLMQRHGMSASEVEHLIYHESGLLGVSGVSSDMRELLTSADPHAAEAVELFVYRIGRELGSLAAALGGIDALVFTAGIGENAPAVRAKVCRAAAWLGVELDETANDAGGPRISGTGSGVSVWVLPTNEELMIANHTRHALG
ncbi:MAG: acetate/propionate family kinase [Planctomycetes bacterium]|nr:acetate/propionate family kinase [Planctomycetota bacterium]